MSWTTLLKNDGNSIKNNVYVNQALQVGAGDNSNVVISNSNSLQSEDYTIKFPIVLNGLDSIATAEDMHANAHLCLNATGDGGTFLRHETFGATVPVGTYVQQIQNKSGVLALVDDLGGYTCWAQINASGAIVRQKGNFTIGCTNLGSGRFRITYTAKSALPYALAICGGLTGADSAGFAYLQDVQLAQLDIVTTDIAGLGTNKDFVVYIAGN